MSSAATACNEIYLDANATTAILPAAQAAMLRVLNDNFGNPGSPHGAGIRARIELDRARAAAAGVLGVPAQNLIFNSGATEGIQTAVLSALQAARQQGATQVKVLYGATEHKAVPQALAHWAALLGLNIKLLAIPVDRAGRHDLAWLAREAGSAALVCTMAANNESGTISDLPGIAAVLDALPQRPLWLVDGVQALGKLQVDWLGLRADYVPMSGHKLHAPKGTGLLYVRDGAPFTCLIAGGGQEGNARSGTENLPGIAALGAICEAILAGELCQPAQLAAAHAELKATISAAFGNVVFNSPAAHCLPTTINFSLPGIPSKRLLEVFDALGVRLSAGSACNTKQAKPSHVLMAMGLGEARAASAIRLSISPAAKPAEIAEACNRIALCGRILREKSAEIAALEEIALLDAQPAQIADYTISAAELPGWAAAHPQAQVLDIREAWEQSASGICPPLAEIGIQAKPLSQLPQWLAGLSQQQPVLLACRSGRRSGQLLSHLHQLGYQQVWHLGDGLAGLPRNRVSVSIEASSMSW